MAEVPRPAASRPPNGHRAHNSCDRCRSRKTKCIDPIPGPCRYCARIGAPCTIATPRRKRPYYHVTEEEYQCSMRILEHFFPNQDLNLQSLRTIAKAIKDGTFAAPPVQQVEGFFSPGHADPAEGEAPDDDEEQDVNDLHEPLGCMMKDSRGAFRYVGAHSEIPFNAAVATLGMQRRNPAIIPTPRVGAYPPNLSTPSPSSSDKQDESFYLPARELCNLYVSRYLEDVHCTYWLYSVEDLLQRVDDTYAGVSSSSSSWMCSLYAIFGIGAANYMRITGSSPPPGSPAAYDSNTSEDYITLAKELIPAVYDEADIDSIRALAIISITMENMMSRVSSYLYMGTSVQMAFTLGLHRDQLSESGSAVERERNRRIWWTLFLLDQEISARGGTPNAIDERYARITTPMSSEKILSPGAQTPFAWLSVSVSLCRLKREIIQTVYAERSANSISLSTISNSLLLLQKWYRQIPGFLQHDKPAPSSHKRAIAVLHLNYWGTTILLTRPFLLYLVIHYSNLVSSNSKKIWFERMSKMCIDAAQKSLTILQRMASEDQLSSVTAFDSTCILRAIVVFILAFAHTNRPIYKSHIDTLLDLVKSMQQVGFTKMVAEETPGRLADLGIFQPARPVKTDGNSSPVDIDDEMIVQLWRNYDPTFMTPLQIQQSLDLTFDDSGAFDIHSEGLAFTSVDDSIVIDPSQQYVIHSHLPQ